MNIEVSVNTDALSEFIEDYKSLVNKYGLSLNMDGQYIKINLTELIDIKIKR